MNKYCELHRTFAPEGEECPKCSADATETAYHDLRSAVGSLLSISHSSEDGLTASAPAVVWSRLTEAYNRCK